MEMFAIVMKLNGPVYAIGESNADAERLQNLHNLMDLTDKLLTEIQDAARSAQNHQASMKKIGVTAAEYMADLLAGDRP